MTEGYYAWREALPSMPRWANSNRRDRLPPPAEWERTRKQVFRLKGRKCLVRGPRCEVIATEIDHKNRGDDHSISNLQPICHQCHKEKSSQEGALELKAKRQEISYKFRRVEDHPGLL